MHVPVHAHPPRPRIDVSLPKKLGHRERGLRDAELENTPCAIVVRKLRLGLRIFDPCCGVCRIELRGMGTGVNRRERRRKLKKRGMAHLDVLLVEGSNAVKCSVLEGKLVGQYHGMT